MSSPAAKPKPKALAPKQTCRWRQPPNHFITADASRHETRLNRDFGQTRFGDAGYALEELVAELASAFIGAHIGLPADHLEDHAAYIDGWLKALGDNPSSFLTAASKAQAAADWVLGEMGA